MFRSRTFLAGFLACVSVLGTTACREGNDTQQPAPLGPLADPTEAATSLAPVVTTALTAPPTTITLTAPPATQPTTTIASATTLAPAVTTPIDTAPVDATSAPVDTEPIDVGTTGVPEVDARAYAVYDPASGAFLAERDADTPLPVASVMKLLTAYVVMQAGDPAQFEVTVPAMRIDPQESVIGLYEGQQTHRDVLLRAMLIVSANDAARALAIDLAGSEEAFAEQMNAAAASLGLTNTHAENPVGLDADGAHSTARDMATLTGVLMRDSEFRTTVARREAKMFAELPATNLPFLSGYAGGNGVKTGHTTQAGYCLVASATRDGRTLIAVVLGASSSNGRTQSAMALLDWAYANSS